MKKLFAFLAVPALTMLSTLANAAKDYTPGADDPFGEFVTTLDDWATGAYGVGIGIASILIGGAIAVGKNSPLPALVGIATAAFVHWGPGIVKTLVGGAVIL